MIQVFLLREICFSGKDYDKADLENIFFSKSSPRLWHVKNRIKTDESQSQMSYMLCLYCFVGVNIRYKRNFETAVKFVELNFCNVPTHSKIWKQINLF